MRVALKRLGRAAKVGDFAPYFVAFTFSRAACNLALCSGVIALTRASTSLRTLARCSAVCRCEGLPFEVAIVGSGLLQ